MSLSTREQCEMAPQPGLLVVKGQKIWVTKGTQSLFSLDSGTQFWRTSIEASLALHFEYLVNVHQWTAAQEACKLETQQAERLFPIQYPAERMRMRMRIFMVPGRLQQATGLSSNPLSAMHEVSRRKGLSCETTLAGEYCTLQSAIGEESTLLTMRQSTET